MKQTHLMIGAGRMGGALLKGWIKGRKPFIAPENIVILDPKPAVEAQAAINIGATHITDVSAPLSDLTHVVLAIKPQMFDAVAPSLAAFIPDDAVIVSIMAGVSLARLSEAFPDRPLVRAMPNTPAAIGAGITAFTATADLEPKQKKLVAKLLSAAGKVEEVSSEAMIDAVTAVSGSGPAYVFYLAEALEAAALDIGLPAELARIFAKETIIGAANLMKNSNETADALRIAVTSPGGTTQAALDVLMGEAGMVPMMKLAVRAALKRAKDLS